ncbi:hypothetical protein XELAEV_18022921mg, partial [Xenopus laevis]
FDADREEEEVFCDISAAVDNKLFPAKKPVAGGPGSGKGTQCEKLSQKYGLSSLAVSELLQNDLGNFTERSKLIKDVMEHGDQVPMDIILELLKETMTSCLGNAKGFLLDGFPRETKQAEEFECKISKPNIVLYLDCSSETMTSRLLNRSKASHRNDVNTETIRRRLDAYYQAVDPIITYYERKSLLYKVNINLVML